jgi:CHASE3 domain sensor protein
MAERIEKRILMVFIGITILLLATVLAIFRSATAILETDAQISRYQETLISAEEIVSSGITLSSSARGFVLSGDTSYLSPIDNAIRHYAEQKAKLDKNNLGDNEAAAEISKLTEFVQTRITYTKQIIRVRQDSGFEKAASLVTQQRRTQNLNDSLRASIDRLRNLHSLRINDLLATNRKNTNLAITLSVAFMLLIALLLSMAYRFIRKDIAWRVEAERKLRELNAGLEEQVAARTKGLQQSFEDLETKVKFRSSELERQNAELREKLARFENK